MEVTDAPCPIVRFNALVGGKYKLRVLWELRNGARRYGEIQRALVEASGGANVTPRVLSRELRALASSQLVTRKQYPVIPPKVEYRLTRQGLALMGVMNAVCKWDEAERQPKRRSKVAFTG
jgi:DNA-binding HxlR family transcriptional regulator